MTPLTVRCYYVSNASQLLLYFRTLVKDNVNDSKEKYEKRWWQSTLIFCLLVEYLSGECESIEEYKDWKFGTMWRLTPGLLVKMMDWKGKLEIESIFEKKISNLLQKLFATSIQEIRAWLQFFSQNKNKKSILKISIFHGDSK